jgi:3-dehydrosphinganine reductase
LNKKRHILTVVIFSLTGTSIAGEFSSLDSGEFARMLNINVLGSVYPTRAVVDGMKRKRGGRVIFVASQVNALFTHINL